MAVGIFIAGMSALTVAYMQRNPYIGGGGVLLNGFLYWPIREIVKLRRDNIILQVLPQLIAQLPPAEAANELKKLLTRIRGK
jgi:hypothetical protein